MDWKDFMIEILQKVRARVCQGKGNSQMGEKVVGPGSIVEKKPYAEIRFTRKFYVGGTPGPVFLFLPFLPLWMSDGSEGRRGLRNVDEEIQARCNEESEGFVSGVRPARVWGRWRKRVVPEEKKKRKGEEGDTTGKTFSLVRAVLVIIIVVPPSPCHPPVNLRTTSDTDAPSSVEWCASSLALFWSHRRRVSIFVRFSLLSTAPPIAKITVGATLPSLFAAMGKHGLW